jgi:XTP/dITP diphosphohydrolase
MLLKKQIKNSSIVFSNLEKAAKKEGKKLSEMTLSEMDVYWEKSKKVFK